MRRTPSLCCAFATTDHATNHAEARDESAHAQHRDASCLAPAQIRRCGVTVTVFPSAINTDGSTIRMSLLHAFDPPKVPNGSGFSGINLHRQGFTRRSQFSSTPPLTSDPDMA
jgi:hypothetical protein